MDTFRSLVLTGLFYERNGEILVQPNEAGPDISLREALQPFVGREVQMVAHHRPPTPVDPKQWGGGCCKWEPAECPAGHHRNPTHLTLMTARGVLHQEVEPIRWIVLKQSGGGVEVPVGKLLGHVSQVTVVTVVELTRNVLTDKEAFAEVLNMGQEIRELISSLNQLRAFVRESPKT